MAVVSVPVIETTALPGWSGVSQSSNGPLQSRAARDVSTRAMHASSTSLYGRSFGTKPGEPVPRQSMAVPAMELGWGTVPWVSSTVQRRRSSRCAQKNSLSMSLGDTRSVSVMKHSPPSVLCQSRSSRHLDDRAPTRLEVPLVVRIHEVVVAAVAWTEPPCAGPGGTRSLGV
jgi:hypothetical protein